MTSFKEKISEIGAGSMSPFAFSHRWKEWIRDNQRNILLFFGVLLAVTFSFESGLLLGKIGSSEPLVISIPAAAETGRDERVTEAAENQGDQSAGMARTALKVGAQPSDQCLFVGSRNSNKYHLATCAVAKRIKSENRVCFASKEDAEKRGYVPSCMK